MFKQVLQSLNVKHVTSSAYHPESQGTLERWHPMLKSILRKYCLQKGKSWDEGIPFVLFAAGESVQESLGFSPAELVFGHTPRGPLQALKERFLLPPEPKEKNMRVFVRDLRDHLRWANDIARECLASAQRKKKKRYEFNAVKGEFQPGDKVITLVPVTGSAQSAKSV